MEFNKPNEPVRDEFPRTVVLNIPLRGQDKSMAERDIEDVAKSVSERNRMMKRFINTFK
jgi:hypothetical protein